MTQQERPKALLSGILYGEFVFWVTIAGMIIAVIGIVMYFSGGDQFFNSQTLMNKLWTGEDAETIWKEVAGREMA